MRIDRLLSHLAISAILLAACAASFAATVALDAATKSATSDDALLSPAKVKSAGDQIGIYVQSKSLQPTKVTIRIANLTSPRYDVYVNWGAFRIKRTKEIAEMTKQDLDTTIIEPGYILRDRPAEELAAGLEFQIPGRVVPAALMRCVTAAKPAIESVYKGIGTTMTGDVGRARWTLGPQAGEGVRSAISTEETYRSVQLFVIPAGVDPREMDWRSRLTARGTKEAVARACQLLQDARVQMAKVLTDPLLRETVVEALTPVEARLRYYVQGGIPRVKVEIANNCNLSISGAVNLSLPKGWTPKPKQLVFKDLKSGQVLSRELTIAPASKRQQPPAELTATVTINVTDKGGTAKLTMPRRLTRS